MTPKTPVLIPAATTYESMEYCIECGYPIFSIEEPLYSQIEKQLPHIQTLHSYSINIYCDKHLLLLTNKHHPIFLNPEKFEIIYPPLTWPNWKA